MRNPPINWEAWFNKIMPVVIIGLIVGVIILVISTIHGCIRHTNKKEIDPVQYSEITSWASNNWTSAFPELKEAIETANEDDKISLEEFRELRAMYEGCKYKDARNLMMRTIEEKEKEKEKVVDQSEF